MEEKIDIAAQSIPGRLAPLLDQFQTDLLTHRVLPWEEFFRELAEARQQVADAPGAQSWAALEKVWAAGKARWVRDGQTVPAYEALHAQLQQILAGLPDTEQTAQAPERFRPLAGDSLRIRLGKLCKRLLRGLGRQRTAVANLFRKLFGRSVQPPTTWQQSVRTRGLVQLVYQVELDGPLHRLVAEVDEVAVRHLMAVLTEGIPAPAPSEFREAATTLLQSRWEELVAATHHQYQHLLDRAGTIEFPERRLRKGMLGRKALHRAALYMVRIQRICGSGARIMEWNRQVARLRDHSFTLKSNREELVLDVRDRLELRVHPLLEQAREEVLQMLGTLREVGDEGFAAAIETARQHNKRHLGPELLSKASNILLDQDIPSIVDRLRHQVQELVPEAGTFWEPVHLTPDAEIPAARTTERYRPSDLIHAELLPPLARRVQAMQSESTTRLSGLRAQCLEAGHIVEYNLETGLAVLADEEGGTKKSREVVLAGLERAAQSLADLREALTELVTKVDEETASATSELLAGLEEMLLPGKLMELRLRMLRNRAIARSEALKTKAVTYLRYGLPLLRDWAMEQFGKAQGKAQELYSYLGFTKTSGLITSQISDFLSESEKAIGRLPLVYQRLFRPEPVSDSMLYVQRTQSEELLAGAFQNWRAGRFAPFVLVGEHGSGRTSLIRNFLEQQAGKTPVIHVEDGNRRYETEEALVALLRDSLGLPAEVETVPDLITAILNRRKPVILVMERLERCFQKRVGGYGGLRALCQIISETNSKIFWIIGVPPSSWAFMERSVQLSDYVGTVHRLDRFTDAQIQEIILKRHRLSGYRLEFLPAPADLKNQKYKTGSQEERAAFLEAEYFRDLNRFADGNLATAFLFWMRSTEAITAEGLKVGSLKALDFSFMEGIPAAKAVALHGILLHGNLDPAELARLQNQSEKQSELLLLSMLDDGILLRQNGRYAINPLLFRYTVSLLEKRNFLH